MRLPVDHVIPPYDPAPFATRRKQRCAPPIHFSSPLHPAFALVPGYFERIISGSSGEKGPQGRSPCHRLYVSPCARDDHAPCPGLDQLSPDPQTMGDREPLIEDSPD